MRALAKAWRWKAFETRIQRPRREAPAVILHHTTRPQEAAAEPEHRGLTARELIRMAQAARPRRD